MCKWGSNTEVKLCIPRENGMMTAKVDTCLAPLVQMLNDYGIQTIACCCGHGKTEKSSIRIHPKNILLIPMDGSLTIHLNFPYKTKEKTNVKKNHTCKEMGHVSSRTCL